MKKLIEQKDALRRSAKEDLAHLVSDDKLIFSAACVFFSIIGGALLLIAIIITENT